MLAVNFDAHFADLMLLATLSGAFALRPGRFTCRSNSDMQLLTSGSPGLINLPQVQRHVGRFSAMSTRASAATLETATKQNVGAAASKSQTYVGLNSGHHMPLIGWGTSGANGDECIKATKAAIQAGYRVRVAGAALQHATMPPWQPEFRRSVNCIHSILSTSITLRWSCCVGIVSNRCHRCHLTFCTHYFISLAVFHSSSVCCSILTLLRCTKTRQR